MADPAPAPHRSGHRKRTLARSGDQKCSRPRLAHAAAGVHLTAGCPRNPGGGCPRKPAAVHGASRRSVGGGCGRDSSDKSRCWGDPSAAQNSGQRCAVTREDTLWSRLGSNQRLSACEGACEGRSTRGGFGGYSRSPAVVSPIKLRTAVKDGLLQSNPAQIDGATRTRCASQSVVPDVDELTRIADLTEPARFKALILNSAWCCLRYDEVTELRPPRILAKVPKSSVA